MRKTAYELFKVPHDATTDEIVQSYRIIIKKLSMIKNKNKVRKLNYLYNICFKILTDPFMRKSYDNILKFIEQKKKRLAYVRRIMKENPGKYHEILVNSKMFTAEELEDYEIKAETEEGFKRAISDIEIEEETLFEKLDKAKNEKSKTKLILKELNTVPSLLMAELIRGWLNEEK